MGNRILSAGFVILLGAWPIQAADPDVLHIGLVESLLQETAASKRKVLGKEFSDLVRDLTGLKSIVMEGLSPDNAARQLDDGKWHLGVFHGVEFAWVQAKHPQLKPLMITATKNPPRAVLVVGTASGAKNIADLKGKNVLLLRHMICQVFMEKSTNHARDYFASVQPTRNAEDALNEVMSGKVQGAFVDSAALDFYKELYPGRFKDLTIAAESEPFPQAVIVYHQGTLSDAMLKRLQDGMLKAKDSDRGKEALNSFNITGFETVPASYQEALTKCLKTYPPQEERK